MKDYIIEVKDGHHHVHMFTDEEMKTIRGMAETFQRIYDTVKEAVENIVTGLCAWIEENNIIELLEEYENELNTGKISTTIEDTSSVRQPNTNTQHARYENGLVHGTDRMGEHSRTLQELEAEQRKGIRCAAR